MHDLLPLQGREWEWCYFSLGEITSCIISKLPYMLESAIVKTSWKLWNQPCRLLSEHWKVAARSGMAYMAWSLIRRQGTEKVACAMKLLSSSRTILSCLFLKGVPPSCCYREDTRSQKERNNSWNWDKSRRRGFVVTSPWMSLIELQPCEKALCPVPVYKRQHGILWGEGGWALKNSLKRRLRTLTHHPDQKMGQWRPLIKDGSQYTQVPSYK